MMGQERKVFMGSRALPCRSERKRVTVGCWCIQSVERMDGEHTGQFKPDEDKWRLSKWALRRDGSEMVDPCILAQLPVASTLEVSSRKAAKLWSSASHVSEL